MSPNIRNSQERWPDGRRRSVYRFQPAESLGTVCAS